MPNMAVYDMAGAKTADLQVPDELLGLPFNPDLVRQAVVAVDHARKRRCGKSIRRDEVDMTGAKWYRQKGLGRARHGARSAPTFVGGGKAHGPTGEQGTHKMPKRMRRKAAAVALSEKVRDGNVTVLDKLELSEISTRKFVAILQALKLSGKILMLLSTAEARDEVVYKSGRNVADLTAREVPHFNTRDIVLADEIVITRAALEQLMKGGADSAE